MDHRFAQVGHSASKASTRRSKEATTSHSRLNVRQAPTVSRAPILSLVPACALLEIIVHRELKNPYPLRPGPTLATMEPQITRSASRAHSSLSQRKKVAVTAQQATVVRQEEQGCQPFAILEIIDQLSRRLGACNARRAPSRTREASKTTLAAWSAHPAELAKRKVSLM